MQFTTSTRTGITLPTSVKCLKAFTMCTTLNFDSRCQHSNIDVIGNVHCPNKKGSGKLCVHRETFQSLDKKDYQYPRCAYICQVRNNPFKEQTISFLLTCNHGIYKSIETQKSIQETIGDVYCPSRHFSRKCVYVHTWEDSGESCYECLQWKGCRHVKNFPFKDQKPKNSFVWW